MRLRAAPGSPARSSWSRFAPSRRSPRDGRAEFAFVEHGLARRKEAWELVEKGRVRVADDAFHAAALLVESDRPAEVARAGELAQQALARDPDLLAARPLIATAADRKEMLAGRPQKFGTQLVEEGGTWKVYDVDPAVTDAERAENQGCPRRRPLCCQRIESLHLGWRCKRSLCHHGPDWRRWPQRHFLPRH